MGEKTTQVNEQKFQYQIEQIYLEIARSITDSSLIKLYRKPGEPDDPNKEANIAFAAASVSIVFAYASIEAFCDIQLYTKFKAITPEIKSAGFSWQFSILKYKEFFKDEESITKFIRYETLQEKLKALASVCNLKLIHETDKDLWTEIDQIAEEMRDFIIHPKPDPKKFQEYMNSIMEKHKLNKYFQIAEKTIKYFYQSTGVEVPEWLNGNTLFRFLNKSDLPKERERPTIESIEKELEDLIKEIISIFHRLDAFQKINDIISANDDLKKMDQTMLINIKVAFAESLVSSIGRLCDKDSRTQSLVQLLENIKIYDEYLTRETSGDT